MEEAKTMPRTREVRIPACEQHLGIFATTVTIPWVCPKCGGPRGEPYAGHSYDGSRRLVVHCWNNPCGHVDKWDDVRAEWQAFEDAAQKQRAPMEMVSVVDWERGRDPYVERGMPRNPSDEDVENVAEMSFQDAASSGYEIVGGIRAWVQYFRDFWADEPVDPVSSAITVRGHRTATAAIEDCIRSVREDLLDDAAYRPRRFRIRGDDNVYNTMAGGLTLRLVLGDDVAGVEDDRDEWAWTCKMTLYSWVPNGDVADLVASDVPAIERVLGRFYEPGEVARELHAHWLASGA